MRFIVSQQNETLDIKLEGTFDIRNVQSWHKALKEKIKEISTSKFKTLTLSGVKEAKLDISSLYLIYKELLSFSSEAKKTLNFEQIPARTLKYFESLQSISLNQYKDRRNHPRTFLEELGFKAYQAFLVFKELVNFFGYIIFKLTGLARRHSRFPISSLFYHIDNSGIQAIPIVCLISFLIGMVLAYQGINQLSRFGAEIFTIDFLAIGVMREIGVLLTAIVVAGRSASSYTAQIGTMMVNQEIDAMKIFQLDPVLYLVIPRIAALLIMLPVLVFISDLLALAGGMLTTQLVIDVGPLQFINHLKRAVAPTTFWVGMSKAPLFALIIAIVGCFRGLQVKGSAESVGIMTTRSVVEAIFLVIVVNGLMSLVFSYLKV